MTETQVGLKAEDVFLFVATPTSHMMTGHVDAMEKLRDACIHAGLVMGVYRETGDGIVRARNRAVARFLASEATHLMFIDDDIGFKAEDVFTMVRSNLDVVCGVYPKKTIDWTRVEQLVKDGFSGEELWKRASPLCVNFTGNQVKVFTSQEGHRFVRVHDAPTGFMMVKRAVIEKMVEKYRDEIEYKPDYEGFEEGDRHHLIFHMDLDPNGSKRYLSEDYWFCRRWQEMGGEIYAYAECRLSHHGAFTFTACMADVLKGPIQPMTEEQVNATLNPLEAAVQDAQVLMTDEQVRQSLAKTEAASEGPMYREES